MSAPQRTPAVEREVFVSGATGVLGSQLALELLEHQSTKLWLLIRADSDAALQTRRHELADYLSALGGRDVLARIECVRGDVERSRFGMDEGDYTRVSRAITHVVHAAADVRFDRTLDEARLTSITGLENAIALARAGAEPRKLEYVSTVGVAGRRRGWVFETPQPVSETVYRNSYEQAKAEAEQYLLHEVERGLPATIHRPTMIVGDSRTGKIKSAQAFYFLVDYFLGRKGDRVLPRCPDIAMDTVPVDYVARAIACSLRRPELAGQILHLSSGRSALRLGEVVERASALLARRGVEPARITTLEHDDYEAYVAAKAVGGSRFHRAVAQFLPYFRDHIEFDNRRSRALLAPEGIELPDVDAYLEPVLTWYWSQRGP